MTALTEPARSGLEEAELLWCVAHQHVFGLLVVIEHFRVVLAADAGLLVSTECGVRRISVIAIRPDATRLNGAAKPVASVRVAAPNTGAEAVERVVCDGECVSIVFEGRHGHDRSEDLFLEDAHLIVTFEDGRLDVIAASEVTAEICG